MQSRKQKFIRGKTAILRWFCVFLFLFLVYWCVMVGFVISDFFDPQYALKPGLLRKRMAEYQGHPLWLIMGSSRVEDGFRPALLVERMGKPGAPVVFNFGLSGSDMFRQLVCLRRLVEDGVKPQRVGIEVLGALMYHKSTLMLDDPRVFDRARRDEVDLFSSYSMDAQRLRKCWWRSRLDPTYEYGMVVPGQTRSVRLIPLPFVWPLGDSRPYDKWGWFPGIARASKEEYYRKLEGTRTQFHEWYDSSGITVNSDRALRQILDLCKSKGIEVFLLRMPESEDYQAFYPPEANAGMDIYLQKIEKEYNVPEINARSWIEREGFSDGHHLNTDGSAKFTLRLGDVLFGPAGTH